MVEKEKKEEVLETDKLKYKEVVKKSYAGIKFMMDSF
jgi:hypothetical protein